MTLARTLENKIAEATSIEERASFEVDYAIYLARAGCAAEAISIFDRYHDATQFGRQIDLACKLILLRGLIHYFNERRLDLSIDRVS